MFHLVFATNNQHKIDEMQVAIGNLIQIITLTEAGINIDIPEPFATLEENARIKSKTIHELCGMDCFSEDTGLEVIALNGEPGVLSARYAGEHKNHHDNIDKLLRKMKGIRDRRARFRTVLSLIWKNSEYTFEGICEGIIATETKGDGGFGYDPVFIPTGSKLTFAEMDLQQKNTFSHRKKAADRLVLFLQTSIHQTS
ncbi:MAG TPA: RdgB/HAM1 family non-canonical purine NTP pyrophosphatase [Flavitalea sp.]|nr:RdgB/HAM1 family non-canonical purine NTP pyrophosphatase [Flavitalea sp.]